MTKVKPSVIIRQRCVFHDHAGLSQTDGQLASVITRESRMSCSGRYFRSSIRSLLKTPVFTAIAVMTLGVGIGATTAIFSLFNAIVLQPLPFRDPDRLVVLWTNDVKR